MSEDSPALGRAVVSDGSQQGMREDSTQVTRKQAPGKIQMSESRFAFPQETSHSSSIKSDFSHPIGWVALHMPSILEF